MPKVDVPNMAVLRLASPAVQSVHVEGFAKPGDGGGGNFFWDQNDPYLLDDNIGIVITSSLTRTGRWRREGFQRLQTASTTIPIIRSGMAWCTIQGITFKGGLHSVGMYGASSQYGGLYNPTAYGNVPSIIKDCFFYYPIGPAIWQDPGPTAAIAAGSNGAVLPQSTIHVDSTANFPPSGTIGILFADGSPQSVNYTGKTPTSFTPCSGGVGTLATGMLVYLPGSYRTFQHTLRVLNFHFAGAHLFWGSGDSVIFSQGNIAWDFTNAVNSTDGLPLGIFNSTDTLYVDHVTAFGSGSQPARPAMFVGTNSINVTATAWGQNDGITFVRARYAANKYQGAGTHPVLMPTEPGSKLALKVNNVVLVCSFGAFWLEIYDDFPASISLKNWHDLSTDFLNTKGIWVDQAALSASEIFTRQKATMNLDIDGVREFPNVRQIYSGFDPGPSAAPARTNGTEITSRFVLARVDDPEDDVDNTFQENLFNNPTADATAVGFGMNGGSTSADHSTGYSVTLWTAGATTGNGPAQVLIPFASLMPNNLPSGVYCFSFYWKANWGDVPALDRRPGS